MKRALPQSLRQRQRGASLIEVLVAFLLLSLGLLGMSALQINALQNSHSSLQRSQATMLAHFMMDAMRANATAARNGDYNLGVLGNPGPPALPDAPVCAVPAVVSLPTHDQDVWMRAMRTILGQANTCVVISCPQVPNVDDPTQCTIQVHWVDTHWDDNPDTGGAAAQMIEIRSLL